MSYPTQLQLTAAWQGDETGRGYISTRNGQGVPMTAIPTNGGKHNTSTGGGSTITQNYASYGSPLGVGTSTILTQAAGAVATGITCVMSFAFRGRYLDLVVAPYYNNNSEDIQGWVDGRYFSIPNAPEYYLNPAASHPTGDGAYFLPVPVNLLDDGPHLCEIYVPLNTDGVTAMKNQIYGYALETRLGIPDYKPVAYELVTVLAANTYANVCGTSQQANPVRKVSIYNTNAVADTVTVDLEGQIIYTAKALAQNDPPIEIDFGDYTLLNGNSAGSSGSQLMRVKCLNGTCVMYTRIREK